MIKLIRTICAASILTGIAGTAIAGEYKYADIILEYYDSGLGALSGPYGGTYPDGPGFPISVNTDVVLGSEPGSTGYNDFLSLPTGSYVVVGFENEVLIDGPGDDLFIEEVGVNGEQAEVWISKDGENFTYLGIADDGVTTSFDFQSIGFSDRVTAVKIIGLDSRGGSPGFDVMNVQGLSGSVTPVVEKAQIAVHGGYIKLDTSESPEELDCIKSNQYGRMIAAPYSNKLFICTAQGWSNISLNMQQKASKMTTTITP
jgi:hypothetical protein